MHNMAYIKDVLITHNQIVTFCQEIVKKIEADIPKEEEIVLLCVLKGSLPFTAELLKNFTRNNVTCEFIRASSYEGNAVESSNNVQFSCQTFDDLKDKNVIIIEDIIDTGQTLLDLKKYIVQQGAKFIKILTLLDKPERRTVEIEADYSGFVIPNEFVIGFGLDYDEKYRNLKDIVIPHPEKL